MGSYLDKPETTKKSEFLENDFLEIGSSSMQGWRINQEDAHNSIPNLSDSVSFFGLYDGHGGSEVAEYCSMKLPEFLKQLDSFKSKNYEKALAEAFMGFDSILLKDEVVEELKKMAKNNPDYEDSDGDDMEEDETAEEIINLHQEATMPLSEVLQKYKLITTEKNNTKTQNVQESNNESASVPGPSSNTCASSSSSSPSSSRKSGAQNTAENQVTSSSVAEDIPISSSTGENSNSNNQCESSDKEKDSSKAVGDISSSSSVQQNGQIASSSSTTSSSSTVTNKDSSSSSNKQKSSTLKPKLDDDSSSNDDYDEELDETYKESPKKQAKNKVEDDSSEDDEDMYGGNEEELDDEEEEEMSNDEEDVSGEEEEEEGDDDGLDDAFMNSMETGPGKASGCTAVVALLDGRDLYVANAGDSRCVLCRGGKVVEMSDDHKPEDDKEYERIRKAGGRVTLDGRVNGGLNLSRAIGDHGYKMNKELPAEEQMITALPDLKKIVLEPQDEFMILACDGIWNYMNNEEVVGFVKDRLDSGKTSLTEICEELFQNCLAPNTMGDGTGCDNMTAIIVKFKKTLFDLPTSTSVSASNQCSETTETTARKRSHETDIECDSVQQAEPIDKKQKMEEEVAPSTVDTT